MFRAGIYARVSTHDQQTLPLQAAPHAGVCGKARLDARTRPLRPSLGHPGHFRTSLTTIHSLFDVPEPHGEDI